MNGKNWATENQHKLISKLIQEKLHLTRQQRTYDVVSMSAEIGTFKFNKAGDIMGGLEIKQASKLIQQLINAPQTIIVKKVSE